MGNVVGALRRFAVQKSRRFNIESRTDRFLDKNVKNAAPKPLATQKEIAKLNEEMPDLMDEIRRPNSELLNRLKNVYVSSHDLPPEKIESKVNPDKPLPFQRKTEILEYGYVELDSVPPGRLSLKQALQLLSKYQLDKTTNTVEKLALDYNLSPKDVGNLVANFKLYTLVDLKPKVLGFNASTDSSDSIDDVKINVVTLNNYMSLMKPKSDKGLIGEGDSKEEKGGKDEAKQPLDKK